VAFKFVAQFVVVGWFPWRNNSGTRWFRAMARDDWLSLISENVSDLSPELERRRETKNESDQDVGSVK
jgi:hypothetical protein